MTICCPILLGCPLPFGCLQLVHTVSGGERLVIPAREAVAGAVPDPELYEAYVALIRRCWAQRPEDRPGFAEVIQDLRWGGGVDHCISPV